MTSFGNVYLLRLFERCGTLLARLAVDTSVSILFDYLYFGFCSVVIVWPFSRLRLNNARHSRLLIYDDKSARINWLVLRVSIIIYTHDILFMTSRPLWNIARIVPIDSEQLFRRWIVKKDQTCRIDNSAERVSAIVSFQFHFSFSIVFSFSRYHSGPPSMTSNDSPSVLDSKGSHSYKDERVPIERRLSFIIHAFSLA